MPKQRSAWGSWNYIGSATTEEEEAVATQAAGGKEVQKKPVFVTYWLNQLQNLPTETMVGHCAGPSLAHALALDTLLRVHALARPMPPPCDKM